MTDTRRGTMNLIPGHTVLTIEEFLIPDWSKTPIDTVDIDNTFNTYLHLYRDLISHILAHSEPSGYAPGSDIFGLQFVERLKADRFMKGLGLNETQVTCFPRSVNATNHTHRMNTIKMLNASYTTFVKHVREIKVEGWLQSFINNLKTNPAHIAQRNEIVLSQLWLLSWTMRLAVRSKHDYLKSRVAEARKKVSDRLTQLENELHTATSANPEDVERKIKGILKILYIEISDVCIHQTMLYAFHCPVLAEMEPTDDYEYYVVDDDSRAAHVFHSITLIQRFQINIRKIVDLKDR